MSRLPAAADVPDFAEDLAARIDDAVRLERLRAALGKLRRGEREVVALCVWSGLSYVQAAEALGVPVGTVRSRLSRARGKLLRLTDVAEHDPGGREPGLASEQVTDDRDHAVRSPRGGTR
jgi:RNA polymerase sigma-70 factor (ECF subfamily)